MDRGSDKLAATTVIDEERKGEMNKEIAIFFSIPFVSRPVTFSRGNVENVVGRANVVGVVWNGAWEEEQTYEGK